MKKLIVILSILALAIVSQADIIVQYTFTNSTQTALAGYNANITPSVFNVYSNQAGFAAGLPGHVTFILGEPGDAGGAINKQAGIWRGASATNGFYHFSFTIDAGYQFDLSSITFYGRSTGTGPANYDLQVSTNLSLSFVSIGSGAQLTNSTWELHTANSTPPTGVTGQFDCRFYGYGASGTGAYGLDSVVIDGTVTAIPEPGTMALMGIGLLGLGILRRKVG